MRSLLRRPLEPFRPLPKDIKIAVALIFLWMFGLSGGVTAALIKQGQQSDERYRQSYQACVRSQVFGPPFLLHIERVEKRLHLGALEEPVEWPPHSHKQVGVLDFYRSTIPKSCPAP